MEDSNTPVDLVPTVGSVEKGREILQRVRSAMSNAQYVKIPTSRIRPMAGQPRTYFHAERIARLADSMRSVGQIQPGIIRPVQMDAERRDRELLDGERRLRSVVAAEIPEYRAMQVDIDDEAAPYVVSVIANFNRESHTTLEVVDSIIKMHEGLKLPLKEIAEVIGFTYMYVTNLYNLRKLRPEVRDMLDPHLVQGKRLLPVTAAVEISRLPAEFQLELATRVLLERVNMKSVRQEVQKTASQYGFELRDRRIDPSEQRKSIERRIEATARAAEMLKTSCTAPGVGTAIKGFSSVSMDAMLKRLTAAAQDLVACHEVLKKVADEKKPVLLKRA